MDKSEEGRKNKNAGARFELKVRADLEEKGLIVDKWTNNLTMVLCDNPEGNFSGKIKMHPAKSFRGRTRTNGFPDFIAFKLAWQMFEQYEVIAVEVKTNGTLKKAEKEKCKWYLDNNIFSKILIASKGSQRGEIVYKEFSSKGRITNNGN